MFGQLIKNDYIRKRIRDKIRIVTSFGTSQGNVLRLVNYIIRYTRQDNSASVGFFPNSKKFAIRATCELTYCFT